MPARYHPLYDDVWDDDAFDASGGLPRAPFEEIGFFVYLCANKRQRPSGISRVTDAQLAIDTRLSVRTVRAYLADLVERRRILRDGSWIFVRGYFSRQPKGPRLVSSVKDDVLACSSISILQEFSEKYPHLAQWSRDRLQTIKGRCNQLDAQSSTEQSRAEQYTPLTPRVPSPDHSGFAEFWTAWPSVRRKAKADALEAWNALHPSLELRHRILAALEGLKATPDWQRDNGRFIPYPHRWLKKARWNDTVTPEHDPYAKFPRIKANGEEEQP